MKIVITSIFFLGLLVLIPSLSAQEKCIYSYDANQTTLEWTAFKYTEKTGVKGTIQKIEVQNTKKSDSILGALRNIKFTLFTDSINSNNPDRDQKIKTYFFGSVRSGSEIRGRFSKIVLEKMGGNAVLNLEFNKSKYAVPVTFDIQEQTLVLKGSLDVLKLGLGAGLQKLNEVCSDLHKGADGKSKLWPTVDFQVTSKLTKECKP